MLHCLQPQAIYFCTNMFEYCLPPTHMFNMLWYYVLLCAPITQNGEMSGIISDVLDEEDIENYSTFRIFSSFANPCSIY